jgi:hypothetical protein
MARRGVSPGQTARAAQSLYLDGLISYPRTSGVVIPEPGIAGLARFAQAIGFDFDTDAFALRPRRLHAPDDPGACHAALHPLFSSGDSPEKIAALADIVADPRQPSSFMRDPERRLVYAEVARHALAAGQTAYIERGYLKEGAPGATAEINDLLADLDWYRDAAPRPPWEMDCELRPGVQVWPPAARIAEALDAARLARPSTLAAHAERLSRLAREIAIKDSCFPVLGATDEAAALYEASPPVLRDGLFAREIDALAALAFRSRLLADLPDTGASGAGEAAAAIGLVLGQASRDALLLFEAAGGDPQALRAALPFASRISPVASPPMASPLAVPFVERPAEIPGWLTPVAEDIQVSPGEAEALLREDPEPSVGASSRDGAFVIADEGGDGDGGHDEISPDRMILDDLESDSAERRALFLGIEAALDEDEAFFADRDVAAAATLDF